MARKYFIETFGCQMNELDSEKIAGNLRRNGMQSTEDALHADVIILNTCCVRERAVQKVYARLGQLKPLKAIRQDLAIGVVGCMAQLEAARILERVPWVNVIAGPRKGHVISNLVEQSLRLQTVAMGLRSDNDSDSLESDCVLRRSRWRANVTISEGCNRNCTFCVVPIARGRERNRDSREIVREVRDLAAQGYIEIVLLGQTVNSYRDPAARNLTFAGLLQELAEIHGVERIRFASPHPVDFSDELLDVMATCAKVCNHIHLPVQSGSTNVLRAMRRGYTRENYCQIISKIRKVSRPIAVSTDIIVGFPKETERDFEETVSLLNEVRYDSVFSFKYSPRPGTAALSLDDDVPEEEKRRRLKIVQELQKDIQRRNNAKCLGEVAEVLVDGRARSRVAIAGRTSENRIVNFDGPEELVGQLASVKITGYGANSLTGIWIRTQSMR